MTNLLPRILLLAAVGLAGLAVVVALLPSSPEPPFIVEALERNRGKLAVGTHEVVFRLTNPAKYARRIIGLMEG